MTTVCEVCGDVGYRQLLIYCRDCKSCAVHQYCLDKVVFDASLIKWFCYECLQRHGEATCISSLDVSSERPLSHDGSRSPVHQLITNSVGSVRDAGPWRNGINESSATKYTSRNRIYSSVKKHTKKKSLMKSMGNCTNRKLRIAKVTTHTSPEASHSCETIGTESAKSNHSRNQQVDHEYPVASVREISVDLISISSSSHDTIEASESSEGFTECEKATSCCCRKTVKMAMASSSSAESGEDAMSENASLEYVLACRSYLSKAQKKRVIKLIQEIQPEFTIFISIMRSSNVQPPGPFLGITKEYAIAHFPDKTTNITLETPGKSKKWHPIFYKRDESRKNLIMGRWLDFVRDNHVQEGDICLLLPTKDQIRYTFMIYVLHETTDCKGGFGFQRIGPCPGSSSAKMASEIHIEEEPTTGEHVSSESDVQEIPHEPLEGGDSDDPFEPRYFVPCRNRLSISQKRIVEERVRAIRSEVPIYVAVMKGNNIGAAQRWMLELGSRYATAVNLPTGEQTVVLMCGKDIWNASIVTYHQRQYLSGGWHKFVRDNGLDLGDICLFELKRNERELTMMVHIIPRKELSSRHGETLKMTVTSSSSGGSGEDIPSENEFFVSDDLQAPGSDYIVSHRSYLSQEQNERVTLLIQEIQPKTAVYIVVMRKSHVHPPAPSVDIMKEYAFAYFPHGNTNVTLQRPGKSKKWHPKFNTTKSRLQGQWLDFVHDNDVQEGDICAFLPPPAKLGRRFTFTVYLLRTTASRSRCETSFQRAGPCPGGGSSQKTASEVYTKEPTDGAYFIDMNGVLHESLESKDSGSPSHPLYFLPSSSDLSKSQKKIVEERVQAIKSEVPIYVAIMKRISLGMSRMSWIPKLELGSRYATAVNLPTGEQTVVLCCGRNIWKANIVTHRRRYYLSGGWHRFVRDNGLGLGDICLFELKRNERELTMMVHIIPSKEL